MANPSSITVTALSANSSVARPAVQTIDTDGTVPVAAGGAMDRLIFEFVNAAAAALTVTIKGGDNPPSPLSQDLAIALTATGGATPAVIAGPFESARFLQDDGSVNITFLAASSTPNCTVRCYRLPKT